MKSAIETSKDIDTGFLCVLWESRTPHEMVDCLTGFYLLCFSLDYEMRDEVRFLAEMCWTKREIELAELKGAA